MAQLVTFAGGRFLISSFSLHLSFFPMQWYYLSDSHERIAISEAQFVPLAARGVLRPATPVWRKGMADWLACGEVKPEIFTAAVARDSDERHPVTDIAAVRGTVIGFSRTLADYRVWMRIAGGLLLAAALLILAGIGWQAWLIIDERAEAIHRWLPFREVLEKRALLDWSVFVLIGLEAVTAILGAWAGGLLMHSASRALAARETGSEPGLHTALRSAGRSLVIGIVWMVCVILAALGLALWLGWDNAFPPPPSPEEQHVTV